MKKIWTKPVVKNLSVKNTENKCPWGCGDGFFKHS